MVFDYRFTGKDNFLAVSGVLFTAVVNLGSNDPGNYRGFFHWHNLTHNDDFSSSYVIGFVAHNLVNIV